MTLLTQTPLTATRMLLFKDLHQFGNGCWFCSHQHCTNWARVGTQSQRAVLPDNHVSEHLPQNYTPKQQLLLLSYWRIVNVFSIGIRSSQADKQPWASHGTHWALLSGHQWPPWRDKWPHDGIQSSVPSKHSHEETTLGLLKISVATLLFWKRSKPSTMGVNPRITWSNTPSGEITSAVCIICNLKVRREVGAHHKNYYQSMESGCWRTYFQRSVSERSNARLHQEGDLTLQGASLPAGKRGWGHLAAETFPLPIAIRSHLSQPHSWTRHLRTIQRPTPSLSTEHGTAVMGASSSQMEMATVRRGTCKNLGILHAVE